MKINKHIQTSVDCVILPVLFVFCLDLPAFVSLVAVVVLSLLSFITRSFSTSVFRLIQSLAIVAGTFWILDKLFALVVSPILIFGFVLVLWVTLCFLFRSRSDFKSANLETLLGRLVLGFYFLYVLLMKPNGLLEHLSMLEAEDNENWLYPVREFHRTGQVKLDVPLGSQGVQFFTRIFTTFVSNLTQEIGSAFSGFSALRTISNSWIFVLLCSLVVVQLLVLEILINFPKPFEKILLTVSSLFFVLIFFRASLFAGHFSTSLLGLTVFGFMYSTLIRQNVKSRLKNFVEWIGLFSITACILGSYNPWLPVAIFGVLISAITEPKVLRFFKKLLQKHFVLVPLVLLLMAVIGAKRMFSKFSRLHDVGGVWRVFDESMWFFSGVILFAVLITFLLRRDKSIGSKHSDLLWSWTLFALFAIVLTISIANPIFEITAHHEISDLAVKLQVLSVILMFGFLFLPSTFISIRKIISEYELASRLQNPMILALFTFCFVSFIWLLSIFTGPRVAAYAAQKSALSFYSQFFWIPLLIHSLRSQVLSKLKGLTSSLLMVCLVVFGLGLLPMARQVLLAKPFSDGQGFSDSWWHDDVLFELDAEPNAIVVCVNSDWREPDISIYVCNRFLQTLTKHVNPAANFRYLAWYQPDEFGKIQTYFDTTELSSNVVVISHAKVNDETMEIFRGVNPKYLKIVIDGDDK